VIATLLALFWWAACLLTVAATAYLLLALAAVLSCRRRQGPGWATPPSVTLLKPLCGLEDGLEEALESFLTQQVASPVRWVFGVADAADPALALARRVAARHPDRAVEFVVDAAVHGPNPKVSNLINMARNGLGEVVVMSDSDIVITPGTLQRTIDALAAPGVGAITALYRARPGRAGDRIRTFGAWFLDYWFLPMAVLHARLAPLAVTYGPLTAVRGDVLARIGGLPALADHLSDDAELGRLVHTAGWTVAFAPDVVETLVNDTDPIDLFDHELRWSRTVRGLDPLGFAFSVVSHLGPLPLFLLLRPSLWTLLAVIAPVALRWLLVRAVEVRFGRAQGLARPGPAAIWLRDVYCFAVWAAAYMVRRVGWRGQRLAVVRRDILQPLASVPDGAP
jgi:ceramide glucosyltransferase